MAPEIKSGPPGCRAVSTCEIDCGILNVHPMEYHPEIFEPYDRLIEITIRGEKKLVPENNSILRCLQYLDMERISNADLCWNGDCGDCQVWVEKEGREKPVIACRTRAAEGMNITRLAPALQ